MPDPTVVGIDPDTKRLSIVITHKQKQRKPDIVIIPLGEEGNHVQGCGIAFRKVGELLHELGKPRVFLEAPVLGVGGPGPTISQAQIGGAVMAAAEEFECQMVLVNNQSWKKRVCGNGNLSKEQIAEKMKEVWPELCKMADGDQNVIDAGAVNLYGQRWVRVSASISRRRKEAGLDA